VKEPNASRTSTGLVKKSPLRVSSSGSVLACSAVADLLRDDDWRLIGGRSTALVQLSPGWYMLVSGRGSQ
jgi:hypothetical protein